ncbi:MAG: hypothetical protein E7664_02900 [Ruminococcaceae bacterium]|nr:hypothetical protein [Oscillospiraceae bacterium]
MAFKMGELFRIGGLTVLGCAATLILRALHTEYAFAIRLAVLAVSAASVILMAEPLLASVKETAVDHGMDRYAATVLRALGIALLTKLCTAVCQDCGEGGMAYGVEMGGKIAILLLCLPLMKDILSFASTLSDMG